MTEIELVADQEVNKLVSLAETAEHEGFEAVWVTDHYNNRNPFVALTAIGGATDEIDIGTGVTNPYYAHPAWITSAIASLDELTDGRAKLGIGPGDESTLKALEIKRESPLYELLDAIKLVRGLLDGGKVDIDGLAKNARLNYGSRDIPIYVGAQGPNMLRMASDHGDGILINASHPRDFEWSLEQIEKGKTDKIPETVAYTSFSVAEDRRKAAEAAKEPVAFIASGSPKQVLERHGIEIEKARKIGEKIEKGDFSEAFSQVTDRMLDAFSIYGTPKECREKVEKIKETGIDTVVVGSPLGPEPEEAIRLTAEELDVR